MRLIKSGIGQQTLLLNKSERAGRDAAYMVRQFVQSGGDFAVDYISLIFEIDGVFYRQYEMSDPVWHEHVIVWLRKDVIKGFECWTPTAAEHQWCEENNEWEGTYVPDETGDKMMLSMNLKDRRPLAHEYYWDGHTSFCRSRMIFAHDLDRHPMTMIEYLTNGISDNEFQPHTKTIHLVEHVKTEQEQVEELLSEQ